MAKSLTQKLKDAKEEIKDLKEQLSKVERDREVFRSNTVRNFKEAIRIHGNGNYWNMSNLIETLTKDIARCEWWYW